MRAHLAMTPPDLGLAGLCGVAAAALFLIVAIGLALVERRSRSLFDDRFIAKARRRRDRIRRRSA